jgi:hypothetical protein
MLVSLRFARKISCKDVADELGPCSRAMDRVGESTVEGLTERVPVAISNNDHRLERGTWCLCLAWPEDIAGCGST